MHKKLRITDMNTEQTIEFAMFLTGHDRETIEQMLEDYLK